MGLLDGKNIVITGVLTDASLAFGVAALAIDEGADVVLTGAGRALSLTERVPLELHVNTCGECQQKLADLQIVKVVAEQAAPRPVHDGRPIFGDWRLTLAHWWLVLTQRCRATLAHWRPTLGQWRPTLRHSRPSLPRWRPSVPHWRPSLPRWRPSLGHRRPNLEYRRPTLGHWRPHVPHWRPTMTAGFVGRALTAVRTDDAASRLRRFVAERLEKFPPRHLAAAAAVPLVITLAGGYARLIEDTVAIHAATIEEAARTR